MARRVGAASAAILIAVTVLLVARLSTGTATPPPRLPPASTGAQLAETAGVDTAFFAGGCFWGVEAVFEHVTGVVSAVSGYSGGTVASPSYDQVTTGSTGHAETVRVIYDPSRMSYAQLLQIFFSVVHDPTQLNRQGPDVGTHYRSAIFYTSDEQQHAASDYIQQLRLSKVFSRPIVTQLLPLEQFYTAEEYHQDFARRHPTHPYIRLHDAPKVANLKREFAALYRDRTD